ncbi:hypothetical protein E3T55_06875 [Cryobacterium frigoriphilum]|uniref:Uncharacterized protein n=1 Tax=Cryobacterium frigoriphilum TaxID=1259150 RepID=A0A4V6QIA3_9MICO|nr:hypothetical protein [Cryobacterium frigoriphilum]TFD52180.1 hypothetical protein E3T55_06875 [Cryobacterium frigoriphilum]
MPVRRDLAERLAEHVDWLRASAVRFDAGTTSEAKRIATSIRSLVHTTDSSTSLLTQMNLRDSMVWRSAVNMVPSDGETHADALWVSVPSVPGFQPIKGMPEHLTDFETWWRGSLGTVEGVELSRHYFVWHAANVDGGAHVDPRLPDHYDSLSRKGGLKPLRINSAGNSYPDRSDPTPSALRTMCTEIVISIEEAKW